MAGASWKDGAAHGGVGRLANRLAARPPGAIDTSIGGLESPQTPSRDDFGNVQNSSASPMQRRADALVDVDLLRLDHRTSLVNPDPRSPIDLDFPAAGTRFRGSSLPFELAPGRPISRGEEIDIPAH